jgi:hypothetical protein
MATFEMVPEGVRVLATHGVSLGQLRELVDVPLDDGRRNS